MSSTPSATEQISVDECDRFDRDGFVVLEGFLAPSHVQTLRTALARAIERRRAGSGTPLQVSAIQEEGNDTRIFHILDDDPLFLDLMDHAPIMPYVRGLLHEKPHFHASDAIWEQEVRPNGKSGWHMDGFDGGYRSLRPNIPHLQLKIGYLLSDMHEPDQGNLMLVPGSHRQDREPTADELAGFDTLPGARQICAGQGTAILFQNAVWHTRGPATRPGGQRILLYYAYELPWMVGNPEHWKYPATFYNGLSPERRALFHGFVFDPPEDRWY